jgi:hypothetical protein
MGGYELLRRRLPFVLIVDGEMDSDSTFEGLANLVRKARIDFGAEVRFLTEKDLDLVVEKKVRPYIGTLEQLKRGKWEVEESADGASEREGENPRSGPARGTDLPSAPRGKFLELDRTGRSLAHAALAEVRYENGFRSWLLYVKPTVTGREPIDILEYHAAHPDFPHETTLDQYFDEAQWESYRRLGEYIADMIFGSLEGKAPNGVLRDPEGSRNGPGSPSAATQLGGEKKASRSREPIRSYS